MNKSNKVFLSENPDETGSVCWTIDASDRTIYDVSASLKFYDCNRSVTLDFDCFNLSDISERVEKLDVLLKEISDFRANLLLCKKQRTKFFY